jgi:curved DNA-binding protein CbpA
MVELLLSGKSYYEVLMLEPGASGREISRSYKTLVKKHHPDMTRKRGESDSRLFKDIARAYSTLKNPDLRKQYDEALEENGQKFNPFKSFAYGYRKIAGTTTELFSGVRTLFADKVLSKRSTAQGEGGDYFTRDSISPELLEMSIEELEERLLYSQNQYVRLHAAMALGFKAQKRSCTALEQALEDSSDIVLKAVIWALGTLKFKKSLTLLKKKYYATGGQLRIFLVRAVMQISENRDADIYPMLVKLVKVDDRGIRLKALELLVKSKKKVLASDIEMVKQSASGTEKDLLDGLYRDKRVIR